MRSYIQIGDKHLSLMVPQADRAPLDNTLLSAMGSAKWSLDRIQGAQIFLVKTLRPSPKSGAALGHTNGNYSRATWGKINGALAGQKLELSYVVESAKGICLTVGRVVQCEKPQPEAPRSSLAELRAKLRGAIDIVNDVKRELGDDAQIKVGDDGILRVVLMMEI